METNRASTTLIKKKGGKIKTWIYLLFAAGDKGNIVNNNKPTFKQCRRMFITKDVSTSNPINI